MIDFPDKLAAIVFTKGCNFRCRYCYNPMLVWPDNVGKTNENKPRDLMPSADPETADLLAFLRSRQGKLDGLVITGGEPTIQADLPDFIAEVKALGLAVKLDTNGTNPEMIKKLLAENSLDYIAMDVKAPPQRYEEVTGGLGQWPIIEKSIKMIRSSGVPYEFRTTVAEGQLGEADILAMASELRGCRRWFLQGLVTAGELLDPEFKAGRYTQAELAAIALKARAVAGHCEIRGYI